MRASWSLWVEYDHIFRRSDTLTYRGVGELRRYASLSGVTSTRCCPESMIVSAPGRAPSMTTFLEGRSPR
jgi:hypothetical protein